MGFFKFNSRVSGGNVGQVLNGRMAAWGGKKPVGFGKGLALVKHHGGGINKNSLFAKLKGWR